MKIFKNIESKRRIGGFILAPLLMIIILLIPFPSLTPQAHKLSGIISLVIILWVSEALPLPVTGLIGSCLCIICGVADAENVFKPYSHPVIYLFMGSFIVAESMKTYGVHKRFGKFILSIKFVGASPFRLLFFSSIITATLSMWISNTAATAIMLPIVIGLVSALSGEKKTMSHFFTKSALIIAYSSSIGGIATPVGTPPNLITLGFLDKIKGIEIDFLRWMAFCIPLSLTMLISLSIYFWLTDRKAGTDFIFKSFTDIEKKTLSRGEKNTIISFSLMVFLWILPGIVGIIAGRSGEVYKFLDKHLPESSVAMIGALVLFLLPINLKKFEMTLKWENVVNIDWGTIILFGSGLSLGSLMFSTGLSKEIGGSIIEWTNVSSLWEITAISILLGILLTEVTSNTAAVNMVIPLVISIADALGMNVLPPSIGACLGASMAFMLPISTPPNAIAYMSGYVPLLKMLKTGIIMDIIAFFEIFLFLRFFY